MPTLSSTTLGRFCRELAGGLDDIPTLLKEWGLSVVQFEALQRSPAFLQEMRTVQQEMQELGNDAGYIYRMKSLSEQLLPDFVKMATDVATNPSLKFEMIKWAAEMARLKEKAQVNAPGARGPSVVFRFGAGLPIQSMTVIPAGESAEVIEAPVVVPAIQVQDENNGWPV